MLDQPGTSMPEPNTAITLCRRAVGQSTPICDVAGKTRSDGTYSFTVSPTSNAVYFVETALPPHRRTASLFIGVRDLVTLSASGSSSAVGQSITFTGTVTPDKAGDYVYLERLGADGDWHIVAVSRVRGDSTFEFVRTFGNDGSKTFRARVPGDPENVGGASNPVTVDVTLPPVAPLPPASSPPSAGLAAANRPRARALCGHCPQPPLAGNTLELALAAILELDS